MAAVEVIQIKGDASDAINALKSVGKEAQNTQKQAEQSSKAINDGMTAIDRRTGGAISAFKGLVGGIKTAVTGFKTLRGAIIATGLGALLIAVTSLVSYFTQTERGAQKLRVVMAALGAAVGAVTDAVISLGEGLFKLFTGDFKGAIETVRKGFEGIGDEIRNDVKAAIELEQAMNRVKVAERELAVDRAEANKQIVQARLIADDLTKSTEERTAAIKRASALEEQVFNKEMAQAKERLRILQAQADLNESDEATLEGIAQQRARVIELETQNFGRRKRLQTEINALLNEELAKTKELETARRAAQKVFTEEAGKEFKAYVDQSVAASKFGTGEIARVARFAVDTTSATTQQSAADVSDYVNVTVANLAAISGAINGFASLAGENTELGKALAITTIIIDTYMGATKAMATYAPPFGQIAAAGVYASGLANLMKVRSTQVPTSGDSTSSASIQAPTAASAQPQFNVVGQSGINQLAQSIGGQFDRPVRAYVVGGEVTTAQQLERQRIRTATFG
jgi:hypothetical protein